MKNVTLITGGARSGKSSHALTLANKYDKKAFIATGIAFDEEMTERINKHKADRGSDYLTIEEPYNLAKAIESVPNNIEIIVIDCLTVWLGNILYGKEGQYNSELAISTFIDAIKNPPCNIIMVTNELGMGIVPENAMARSFRDIAGRVNQRIAEIADTVILAVSGIPVVIKQ